MFAAINVVAAEALKIVRPDNPCTLQDIHNIVTAYTAIDEILYQGYESEPENPIWGEFLRWSQFEPYKGEVNLVEVRYAGHLNRSWRRFVVAKELCHSFEANAGTHTVSNEEVSSLINELALASAARGGNGVSGSLPANAERVAEACAVELLLPLPFRKELLQSHADHDQLLTEISELHHLPARYVKLAFDPEYIALIESILDQYR